MIAAMMLAQIAAPAPSPARPPVITQVVTSPPRFSAAPQVLVAPNVPPPRTRLSVTLRAPMSVLWDGRLWLVPNGQSTWTETRNEPPEQSCVGAQYYGNQRSAETSVTLQMLQREPEAPLLMVTVRWARPSEAPCGGTRTIELRETVPFPGDRPAVIRGDGGLSVEIRRASGSN
jgi:hypothetical protein